MEVLQSEEVSCPICGSSVGIESLEALGLSLEDVEQIAEFMERGVLLDLLRLGEIAERHLKPELLGIQADAAKALETLRTVSTEFLKDREEAIAKLAEAEKGERRELLEEAQKELREVHERYEKELKKAQDEIKRLEEDRLRELKEVRDHLVILREKVVGPGIGGVEEDAVLKALAAVARSDCFDSKAAKGGADIVATVVDEGLKKGRIVISVKKAQKWSGEFLTQLERNLRQEEAEFGMLVSTVFPRDALSDKAYLTKEGWVLVRPEYVTVAYLGIREAIIERHRAQAMIKTREAQLERLQHLYEILREWLMGEAFGEVLERLSNACKESERTEKIVWQLKNYIERRVTNIIKGQTALREHLSLAEVALEDLRKRMAEKILVEDE